MKGIQRNVVIVDCANIKIHFLRIAKQTGIYHWEKYVEASSNPDWEKVAFNWINQGIDPDK